MPNCVACARPNTPHLEFVACAAMEAFLRKAGGIRKPIIPLRLGPNRRDLCAIVSHLMRTRHLAGPAVFARTGARLDATALTLDGQQVLVVEDATIFTPEFREAMCNCRLPRTRLVLLLLKPDEELPEAWGRPFRMHLSHVQEYPNLRLRRPQIERIVTTCLTYVSQGVPRMPRLTPAGRSAIYGHINRFQGVDELIETLRQGIAHWERRGRSEGLMPEDLFPELARELRV